MSSARRLFAFLLVALVIEGCVGETPPFDGETRPPASEAASSIEPNAIPSDTPTVPPNETTTTPGIATASVPVSDLPSCDETASVDAGMMELAFVADWDGDLDVYTIQADGSDLRQFTNNPGADVGPAWSKDGQQLALVTDALDDPRLYISPADGSAGRIVAPDLEVTTLQVEWSPKGDLVAIRNMDDLYVISMVTGQATVLTGNTNIDPGPAQFSPDGTLVAFEADVPGGRERLFVVNVDGTGLTELSSALEEVHRPVWHPTQDKILFEGLISSEGFGLYVASLDGTIEKLPIVPRYGVPRPAWSPDGSMIGYIVRFSVLGSSGEIVQKNSLHVATADGNVDVELVSPPDEPDAELQLHEITWAPDSRHLAYTTVSEGRTDLFVLDICNGTSSLVVQGVDFFSTPSWRPPP